MLGENSPSIDNHIKDAAGAHFKLYVHIALFFQICRQTGSFWLIVSYAAINNFDVHICLPICVADANYPVSDG